MLEALQRPFRDPRWLSKCLLQGLLGLVPVVGWIALLGWQRRVFSAARRGDDALPEPALALGDGAPLAIALVVWMAIPGVPLGVAATALAATHHRVSGYLPPEILQFPLGLYAFATYPELLRRALSRSEWWAALRPAATIAAIRARPLSFLKAAGATFLALLVVAMGANACGVGLLLSAPVGHAMAAYVAFAWAREVDAIDGPRVPYR